MKAKNREIEKYRRRDIERVGYGCEGEGNNGAFVVPAMAAPLGCALFIIASDGMGWDHVSVSVDGPKRCPTWTEMCFIKDLFFGPDETVIQYHPAKEYYVNYHKYTLHIWRPQREAIPLPLDIMVGPKPEAAK